MDKGKIEAMVTKFSEKFAIIMLKKHRKFCRCGLTHLDATPTFKNRPNTYDAPCIFFMPNLKFKYWMLSNLGQEQKVNNTTVVFHTTGYLIAKWIK